MTQSWFAQVPKNIQLKHAASSDAPLPDSKRRKSSSTHAAVSAAFNEEDAVIAGDVLETQEDHERRHPGNGWKTTCNLDGQASIEFVRVLAGCLHISLDASTL
jgi:hypothetical protein